MKKRISLTDEFKTQEETLQMFAAAFNIAQQKFICGLCHKSEYEGFHVNVLNRPNFLCVNCFWNSIVKASKLP